MFTKTVQSVIAESWLRRKDSQASCDTKIIKLSKKYLYNEPSMTRLKQFIAGSYINYQYSGSQMMGCFAAK